MRRRRLTVILLAIAVALVPAAGGDALAKKRKKPTRGQCTVWANYKRPDLKISANGGRWDEIARAKGFPVDTKPRKGDIAVWESRQRGAAPQGHVAYVVRVQRSGKLTVSEFNWNTQERYSSRKNVAPAGLKFIHRKP